MNSELQTLLLQERDSLISEADRLKNEILHRQARQTEVRDKLTHVNALLGEGVTSGDAENAELGPGHKPVGVGEAPLCDIAMQVLSERDGEPMHYKDLTREVMGRGGVINGERPWGVLNARLVRDKRFVRPVRRGYYALRSDYPNAANVGARRRN